MFSFVLFCFVLRRSATSIIPIYLVPVSHAIMSSTRTHLHMQLCPSPCKTVLAVNLGRKLNALGRRNTFAICFTSYVHVMNDLGHVRPLGLRCNHKIREYSCGIIYVGSVPTSFPGVIDLTAPFFPSMPCSIITGSTIHGESRNFDDQLSSNFYRFVILCNSVQSLSGKFPEKRREYYSHSKFLLEAFGGYEPI